MFLIYLNALFKSAEKSFSNKTPLLYNIDIKQLLIILVTFTHKERKYYCCSFALHKSEINALLKLKCQNLSTRQETNRKLHDAVNIGILPYMNTLRI